MSSLKIRILAVSAVILTLCTVYWVFFREEPTAGKGSETAQHELRRAPAFALKDRSGALHQLSEARGKVVLVHFWAAWCPPCLAEIPELVEFAQRFENEPKLRIIAISMDEKWEDAEKALPSSKLPKNMISLLDAGAQTPESYGTYQFPETYLLDPDGRIVLKWVAGQHWNSPEAETAMKKELAKVQ